MRWILMMLLFVLMPNPRSSAGIEPVADLDFTVISRLPADCHSIVAGYCQLDVGVGLLVKAN